jgi:hypothetical protein
MADVEIERALGAQLLRNHTDEAVRRRGGTDESRTGGRPMAAGKAEGRGTIHGWR